jgi:hypothetical protein
MNWVDELIENYHKWLRSNTLGAIDPSSGWASITTPFSGVFNDLLEIYVQRLNGKFLLSDDGTTIHNLALVGAKIRKGEKREDLFNQVLINYGVKLNDEELWIEATSDNFSQKKHNFLSALIELNDISLLSTHNVANLFKDDVRAYLDENQIIYSPDFICKGSSGIEFIFDFQVARKDREVVLKSFNSLNRQNLPAFLYAWEDIRPVREKISKKEVSAIAVINDVEKNVGGEFLEALQSKNASYVLWSQRSQDNALLALKP